MIIRLFQTKLLFPLVLFLVRNDGSFVSSTYWSGLTPKGKPLKTPDDRLRGASKETPHFPQLCTKPSTSEIFRGSTFTMQFHRWIFGLSFEFTFALDRYKTWSWQEEWGLADHARLEHVSFAVRRRTNATSYSRVHIAKVSVPYHEFFECFLNYWHRSKCWMHISKWRQDAANGLLHWVNLPFF